MDKKLVQRVGRLLQFFEMIEKKNDIYLVCEIPTQSDQISMSINFKLHILKKFRSIIGNFPKWKKNAVSFLIIEYLIKNNQLLINYTDPLLISKLNNYFSNERDYKPRQQGQGNIIQLNSNKLENWCEIFRYLGFINKISSKQYIFDIDNELLKALIIIFSEKLDSKILPLYEFFDWLNDIYFLIRITGNKIPEILCKKLYSLCKENFIRFIKSGDSQIMELRNKPIYLNIPANINAIELMN